LIFFQAGRDRPGCPAQASWGGKESWEENNRSNPKRVFFAFQNEAGTLDGKEMTRRYTYCFFVILISLFFVGCGGGSGGSATVSGGDGTSTNAISSQKIVFAGGSTIARGNWTAYFGFPIENDGVWGFESWQLVNAIDGYIASRPDKIFIMIGANNILSRHESVLVGDMATIIEKVRKASPGTQIFIMSILPVKNNFSNTLIESYNNQIQSLCTAKNVKFIYLYSLFKNSATLINSNYYLSDGIHLTEAGYQVFFNAIKGYILS
jgi:hypothetical protein